MNLLENIYPALTVASVVLFVVGTVLLVVPEAAPSRVVTLMESLPDTWVLPVVLLWIGGGVLLLVLFRSRL